MTSARARARVLGVVQGVGFRPYVYRLAGELGLSGFVFNDSEGVLLEVEGRAAAVSEFFARLAPDAPPRAMIERVIVHRREPTGETVFRILDSHHEGVPDADVSADTATCEACVRELFDPADRRFRYPFINCTDCGPRFTIVRGIPYDRPLTTMAGFRMCPRCQAEYDDPSDRRFHAQPNACRECGPAVSLLLPDGHACDLDGARDATQAAASALRAGRVIAVKGIGGFHVACDAADERAVASLRARKHREDKPFALMAPDLQTAQSLVQLGAQERALFTSPERPIVLARRRARARVAPSVAPGMPELGVMLPYSPLHHLLLNDAGTTLVMTSGNASDEPIAYRDEDALARLGGIADLVLTHDRPIETRTDDSVLRVVSAPRARHVSLLRRSRGYVPATLPLPVGTPRPLLACGAQLKSTFCLAKGERAWVSHHIGDLEHYETLRSFQDGVEHFQRLFAVSPEAIAHDLHPEYISTKYALEREGVEPIGVQHHHAHLAACLAEHGETGPAIGAIFDGSGYGTDGGLWGGEILHGDLAGFHRAGALLPVRLPGGERAIRQPWRMACAWLSATLDNDEPELPAALAGRVEPRAWGQIHQLVRTGAGSPLTTSMARLFDAVAALCGLRAEVKYEGQAAIELEAICDPHEKRRYPITLSADDEMLLIDPRATVHAVARDVAAGVPIGRIASRFHAAVTRAAAGACVLVARTHDLDLIVLSGGVFANRRLLEATAASLHAAGLRVLTPQRLPAGDGGISYGQAAIAARRLTSQ